MERLKNSIFIGVIFLLIGGAAGITYEDYVRDQRVVSAIERGWFQWENQLYTIEQNNTIGKKISS